MHCSKIAVRQEVALSNESKQDAASLASACMASHPSQAICISLENFSNPFAVPSAPQLVLNPCATAWQQHGNSMATCHIDQVNVYRTRL